MSKDIENCKRDKTDNELENNKQKVKSDDFYEFDESNEPDYLNEPEKFKWELDEEYENDISMDRNGFGG